jgi:MOSC domain-containing protein YiiM
MHILSANRGKVAPLFVSESGVTQSVISGIRKQAVDSPVQIGILGMEGDEQADLTVHGGVDKALYLYPYEHYAFWEKTYFDALKKATQLAPGAMGENLTTTGIMEHDLWVGDRLKIGEVLLEVTEPRAPCYKFAARMGFRHAVKHMLQSGFTGVYLKVIKQGSIQAKSTITLLPGPREVSIADINGRRLKGRQRDLFP